MRRLEVVPDDSGDHESPLEYADWRVASFSQRHVSYQHPDDFDLTVDDFGDVSSTNVGLRRKLACGTAFVLSYHEHGSCVWSLKGTGPQCRWDTAQIAGLLLYEGDPRLLPKGVEARAAQAASLLETYTAWCNGWLWGWRIVDDDDDDEVVDACWGYYSEAEARAEGEQAL